MKVALLLLLLLSVSISNAAFSTWSAAPNLYIRPPFLGTTLLLDTITVGFDLVAGNFFINSSTYYADFSLTEKLVAYGNDTAILKQFASQLPPVQLYGNLSFAQPQLVQFSYPNNSVLYCVQARSAPPLCPLFQTYTNGPFVFSASPSLANPIVLILQTNTEGFIDPLTNSPYNFFYAPQAISLTCSSGSCASLANVVPALPLPANISVTVRRFLRI
jgi:hypothetical protein